MENLFWNDYTKSRYPNYGAWAYKKKLEREGYRFVKQEQTFSKQLIGNLSIIFKCSIPVYNVIRSIAIISMYDNEKMYELLKSKMLESDIYNRL